MGFNDFMWELEIDQLLHMRVEKLDQDCDRIHLIHSDIVNQCPERDLAEFLVVSIRIYLMIWNFVTFTIHIRLIGLHLVFVS